MGHKADKSFFNKKHQWSKRKDKVLECYLPPYLSKIATQKSPVLIVDAFAGPGQFGDGEFGSPLIICQVVEAALARGLSVPVSVLCIEPLKDLYDKLVGLIHQFPFAQAKRGEFGDYIHDIEQQARNHSVFLYVDPWTVEGLDWNRMDCVFQHLTVSNMSIEVLLNFNAPSFVRRALAALKLAVPEPNPKNEDTDEIDAPIETPASVEALNTVVGGSWWQPLIESQSNFSRKVQDLTNGVCAQLSHRFSSLFTTARSRERTNEKA